MSENKRRLKSQIISGLSKSLKIILLFIFSASLLLLFHFFIMPNNCENDFKVYPEAGYCEFNLKTCEGLFGCLEHKNVQIPCGSTATLCGEKVLCDCIDEIEPLSYTSEGLEVVKEKRPFTYTPSQLSLMSKECSKDNDDDYFDKLVDKFNSSKEISYSFSYREGDEDSRPFVVTLIANEAGYRNLEEFKKDFDLCAAGGDLYPSQLNSDWLLFVSSCGSGAGGEASDDQFSCDTIKKIVEPSLEIKYTWK